MHGSTGDIVFLGCKTDALEPVFEDALENRSEVFFTWYADLPRFPVGLYRLKSFPTNSGR